jgi:hypothetical protein
MKYLKKTLLKTIDSFILLRGTSVAIAMLLGLYFSRTLGPTNRAALTAILMINMVCSSLFLNPYNLIRSSKDPSNNKSTSKYNPAISLLVIFTYSVLLTAIVTIYLDRSFAVELSTLVLSFLYALTAGMSYQLALTQIREKKVKSFAVRELLISSVQIIAVVFLKVSSLSSLNQILLSLVLGYSAAIVQTLVKDKVKLEFSELTSELRFNYRRIRRWRKYDLILLLSIWANISVAYGIFIVLMICISPSEYAKFSVLYSVVSLPLILSEGFILASIAEAQNAPSRKWKFFFITLIISLQLIIGIILFFYTEKIVLILGPEWIYSRSEVVSIFSYGIIYTLYQLLFFSEIGIEKRAGNLTHFLFVVVAPTFMCTVAIVTNTVNTISIAVIYSVSLVCYIFISQNLLFDKGPR